MPFTSKQFALGVSFLKENDFYDLWCGFQIPEKWHEEKQVYGIDEFTMSKRTTNVLQFEQQKIVYDDHEEKDMTYSLIKAVFGSCTCQTFAEYVYALMVHIQKLDKRESERIDKEIDAWQVEQDKQDKVYEEFEKYVNDSP